MKQHFRFLLPVFCAVSIAFLLFLSLSSPARFEDFCDTFFQEALSENTLTLHYTLEQPENYGIEQKTVSLGQYSADTGARERELKKLLRKLQFIAPGSLSENRQQTYRLLRETLQTELSGLSYALLEEPLVPSIGIQSQLPILLAEYRISTISDAEEYLQLLSCIPEYFDSLIAYEKLRCEKGLFTDRETAEELIRCCNEFLADSGNHFLQETFQERLAGLSLSPKEQASYLQEHRALLDSAVFPAYEALKAFLMNARESGTNENGLYYFENGTEYYAWLLRSEVGTDKSFAEIEAALDRALKKEASAIAALLKENPELLSRQNNLSFDISNPAGLTAYLSKRILKDFPEIPDTAFEIREVPASLEAHLSPAFYVIPPLDRTDENVIYLNNGSLKEPLSFFTTLAHESYPGHLYQQVYERSANHHPVHRLLYFGGYSEGWATYAEQLSYAYAPISSQLASLLSALRSMNLNIYSHLDLYIHAYGWTEAQCETFLKKFGITGAASVHEIFLLVKQQPANYLKYYLGYLEICELRETAEEALGSAFHLKDFHRFVLENGPAPFWILEKELKEWISSFLHASVGI